MKSQLTLMSYACFVPYKEATRRIEAKFKVARLRVKQISICVSIDMIACIQYLTREATRLAAIISSIFL